MINYTTVDQQIHVLCQIIAKANRTYVPKKEDDSHTTVFFDNINNRIIGRWIESPKGNIILSLNLSNLKFEWLNDTFQLLTSIIAVGSTTSEIEENLSTAIGNLGLNPDGFRDELHFNIPEYSFAKNAITSINQPDLNTWTTYRSLANNVCHQVLDAVQIEEEVRLWPHHFDTGFYITVNENLGLGFGFAMEDDMAKSPYYYISGYALQGKIDYTNMPNLEKGRWETDGFKGAILPLSEIILLNEKETNSVIENFIRTSLNWYLRLK